MPCSIAMMRNLFCLFIHSLLTLHELYTCRVNPANWMLEVTSPAAEAALDISFADTYSKSALAQQNLKAIQQLALPAPDSKPLSLSQLKPAPWSVQFTQLFLRDFRSYHRDLPYNLTRMIMAVLMGIVYVMNSCC